MLKNRRKVLYLGYRTLASRFFLATGEAVLHGDRSHSLSLIGNQDLVQFRQAEVKADGPGTPSSFSCDRGQILGHRWRAQHREVKTVSELLGSTWPLPAPTSVLHCCSLCPGSLTSPFAVHSQSPCLQATPLGLTHSSLCPA